MIKNSVRQKVKLCRMRKEAKWLLTLIGEDWGIRVLPAGEDKLRPVHANVNKRFEAVIGSRRTERRVVAGKGMFDELVTVPWKDAVQEEAPAAPHLAATPLPRRPTGRRARSSLSGCKAPITSIGPGATRRSTPVRWCLPAGRCTWRDLRCWSMTKRPSAIPMIRPFRPDSPRKWPPCAARAADRFWRFPPMRAKCWPLTISAPLRPSTEWPPPMAGDFDHVAGAAVTKSDLGYYVLAEEQAAGVVLKKLNDYRLEAGRFDANCGYGLKSFAPESATTGRAGGMRKAPKRGRVGGLRFTQTNRVPGHARLSLGPGCTA